MAGHQDLTGSNVHTPYRQVFADETARLADATVYVAADLNKKALQVDTNAEYRLSAITPTWTAVGGGTPELQWHTATITNDTFTGAVGTLYPWTDTVGSPTMTFPASPANNDMIGVKSVAKTANFVFSITTNGHDVEDPGNDSSTPSVSGFYVHPETGGFGGELATVIWRYSSLTTKWHVMQAFKSDNQPVLPPP